MIKEKNRTQFCLCIEEAVYQKSERKLIREATKRPRVTLVEWMDEVKYKAILEKRKKKPVPVCTRLEILAEVQLLTGQL